ncbi:MAG: NRDE family protein [Candidatus Binatia bacterium]
MCTLAVYRRVSPLYPLIVVANRDEFLGRASSPPAPWRDTGEIGARIVAGRDLVAGGTWLGCRTDGSGRVVGILNRRPAVDRPAAGPGERSRGLLCLETLAAPSLPGHLESLAAGEVRRYGGFNLFAADLERAVVLDNGDGPRRVLLEDGLSVLTNLDVNDPRCPRLAGATRRFEALRPMLAGGADVKAVVAELAAVLASHEDSDVVDGEVTARFGAEAAAGFARICVHVADYGTRSSSMIFVSATGGVRYFHADGPPCTTAFGELRLEG